MGDRGPTHQVGTLSGCANDLHSGGILQIIYTRDRPVTWSTSLYRIGPGSQVSNLFLGEFPVSHRDTMVISTAFHLYTDGQSERSIQTLEDMLRACVLNLKGSWEEHLPLVEFAYNSRSQASIQMAPYEVWEAMSISGLLDGCGREIRYRSGFGKGHLEKYGLDRETSSHGSEPTKKLCRQTAATSRI